MGYNIEPHLSYLIAMRFTSRNRTDFSISWSKCDDPLQCFLPSPFCSSSLTSLLPKSACSSSARCLASVSISNSLRRHKRNPVESLSSSVCFLFHGSNRDQAAQDGLKVSLLVGIDGVVEKKDKNEDEVKCSSKESLGAVKTSKHLLAGAMSAVISRTVVAPLERLKLEYMLRGATADVMDVVKMILSSEGLKGFWKGNLINLIRTAPFKSINFYAYDIIRKRITSTSGRKDITKLEKLAAGAAAGIFATILCFPMDTIRTRMVAPGGESMGGIIGCFKYLICNQGISSLYAGLLPSVLSMAPAGAVFYGVYDILKSGYLSSPAGQEELRRRAIEGKAASQHMELGPLRTLVYGAIAGACAETVTYPFEVVRRHLQMQTAANRLGLLPTIQGLVQQGGIGALYAGLLPSTLQVLPSAALSYFVYEWLKMTLKVT